MQNPERVQAKFKSESIEEKFEKASKELINIIWNKSYQDIEAIPIRVESTNTGVSIVN